MKKRGNLKLADKSANWLALCEQALADPPNPQALYVALKRRATLFRIAHNRHPLSVDIPESVLDFFKLYVPRDKRKGRPSFDTRRARAASLAWDKVVKRDGYESYRDLISFLKLADKQGVVIKQPELDFSLNDIGRQGINDSSPSNLALELIAHEKDLLTKGDALSVEHVKELLGMKHRKPK